ncbi:MAG: sigma-70 family RNA polymerase sigma factor [Bacteroidota bacterium]|nr:sigma-70 family RNA polymerase sigma factor [Bacteroidota bacterium]
MRGEGITTSDSYLWDEFRLGDDQAFVEIYKKFVDVLYRYGLKFTADDQLVKDCVQELFIDLYERRGNLGESDNIKFYLLVSLKRRLIKILRSKNIYSSLSQEDIPFLIVYSPEDETLKEEQMELMNKTLNELTPRQKEAIYLRFMNGLSYEEICEIMAMNYQSIRNLIFRAEEKMRGIISKS